MDTIYLDHAATTPLDSRVRAAMEPYLDAAFGNPSSIHRAGQRARMATDEARESVADMIGTDPSEVVFTSGGTESDNAAIRGLAFAGSGGHIVISAIEHEAVLEVTQELELRHGFSVTRVLPGSDGVVGVAEFAAALRPDTAFASLMYANNEVGTVQPVAEVGQICRERGIPFHVDAVQAAGSISVDVRRDSIDLLSISAHKLHGPKGVGALVVRRGVPWRPQQLGGGQERQRRSGTENVAGIVGLAEALHLSVSALPETIPHLEAMRDFLFDAILAAVPYAVVNGSRMHRLPGNVNVSFPGLSGESLVMALDSRGVLVSSGSACSSGSTEPSHVLAAMGIPPDVAAGAVRMTLGRDNTWEEVRHAARGVVEVLARLTGEPTPSIPEVAGAR